MIRRAIFAMTKFVPLLFMAAWAVGIVAFIREPSILRFFVGFAVIYLVPPLSYRAIAPLFPIKTGTSRLGRDQPPSGWAVAHRFQILFSVFEDLERILRVIPGAYSFWLRLWGSKIGKRVYWTPHTRVGDRTHFVIGNDVFIGNASYLSPHIVKRKPDGFLLLIRPIVLEDGALVGTHSMLGPGTHAKAGQHLEPFTLAMNGKFRKFEIADEDKPESA